MLGWDCLQAVRASGEAECLLQRDTSQLAKNLHRNPLRALAGVLRVSRQGMKVWRENDGWWAIRLISAIPRKHHVPVLRWSPRGWKEQGWVARQDVPLRHPEAGGADRGESALDARRVSLKEQLSGSRKWFFSGFRAMVESGLHNRRKYIFYFMMNGNASLLLFQVILLKTSWWLTFLEIKM